MTKTTGKKDPKKKSVKIKDADKPSSSKPVAFVVPSIVIVPGTPHANREPFKCKLDIEEDGDVEKLEEDKKEIAKDVESNPEIVINDEAPPLISIDEVENTKIKPISLSAQEEKSRRFSKLPPAPKNAPNAEKVGSKFAKIEIPEIIQATELEVKDDFDELLEINDEDNNIKNPVVKIDEPNSDVQDENESGNVNLLALSGSAKSRRFSKLPPSPKDAPNAVQLGSKFTKIEIANESIAEQANKEEEEIKNNEMLLNPGLLDVTQLNEKSRRFSKLPPAPLDAPNAVQLGSKFTMIPRDLTQKQ